MPLIMASASELVFLWTHYNRSLQYESKIYRTYNGVGVLQQNRCGGQVTMTHFINHNLELAIHDVRKEEPYLDIFLKTFKVIIIN